jgi:hypothetical protein
MTTETIVTVIHGAVALAIVAAATVLLAMHDVDSTTALALYGAALALVGGTTNMLLALKVDGVSRQNRLSRQSTGGGRLHPAVAGG